MRDQTCVSSALGAVVAVAVGPGLMRGAGVGASPRICVPVPAVGDGLAAGEEHATRAMQSATALLVRFTQVPNG
jgi:hypothetical protein